MLALFVCLYWVICQITQACFHLVRVCHAVSICPFQSNKRGSGSCSARPLERRERMIFKKVLLSGKPIGLKRLPWYLVSSILGSMNGVFVAQTRVKNVINSTALHGGIMPAQKYVSRMGNISVFWVLAGYLCPLSSLIRPFLITFLSSLPHTPAPLTDGKQMIIWTGKVEVTLQLKSHLIKWAS